MSAQPWTSDDDGDVISVASLTTTEPDPPTPTTDVDDMTDDGGVAITGAALHDDEMFPDTLVVDEPMQWQDTLVVDERVLDTLVVDFEPVLDTLVVNFEPIPDTLVVNFNEPMPDSLATDGPDNDYTLVVEDFKQKIEAAEARANQWFNDDVQWRRAMSPKAKMRRHVWRQTAMEALWATAEATMGVEEAGRIKLARDEIHSTWRATISRERFNGTLTNSRRAEIERLCHEGIHGAWRRMGWAVSTSEGIEWLRVC